MVVFLITLEGSFFQQQLLCNLWFCKAELKGQVRRLGFLLVALTGLGLLAMLLLVEAEEVVRAF